MSREFSFTLAVLLILGAFALAFALAGCATPPPVVVGKVDTVTVDKTVAVACIRPEDVPAAVGRVPIPAGADDRQKAAALAEELKQRRLYDDTAGKLLANCTTVAGKSN